MKKRYAESRMNMILTQEEERRIYCNEKNGELVVTVDVHGLKVPKAERLIKNIIAVIRTQFHLVVIHGYRHGTAILEMLRNNFTDVRVTSIRGCKSNCGKTIMAVAA